MSLLPDLVLTNVQMARISGFEMVEKIRRDLTEPCIIFVTSKDGPGARDTGLGVGGDGYITKPFDPDDFVHVVDGILAGTSERRGGLADRRRASD
jgi:two-component system, OmpR family, response regulator